MVGADPLPLVRGEGQDARSFELAQLPRKRANLVGPSLGLLLGVRQRARLPAATGVSVGPCVPLHGEKKKRT